MPKQDEYRIWQYCKRIMRENSSPIFLSLMLFMCTQAGIAQTDTLKNVKLREVTVTGRNVVSYPDKDVWSITREMRKNTFDTYSLLEKIPGFIYDKNSNRLTYWGEDKVLITIDGKKKDSDYGGNLANMRFKKIEIYQHPSGRFADFNVVVNLITYEDWQGYDVYEHGRMVLLPSTAYGNRLSDANSTLYYTYTRPKVDVSGGYRFVYEDHRNRQHSEMMENDITLKSVNGEDATSNTRKNFHEGFADIDYKLSKQHILSAKYTYTGNVNKAVSKGWYEKTGLADGNTLELFRNGHNRYDVQENTLSAFYQMNLENTGLNVELTYNDYQENNNYVFQESAGYTATSRLNNSRHSYLLDVSGDTKCGKEGTLRYGVTIYHRKYKSESLTDREYFQSSFGRQRAYMNLSFRLSDMLSGRIGASVEYIQNENPSGSDNQFVWGGNALLRLGKWGDKFTMDLDYRSTTSHPTLYQTISIKNHSDSLVYYTGNQSLKSSTNHSVSVFGRLYLSRWVRFGTNCTFSYSPNAIMPTYQQEGSMILRTFDNIDYGRYRITLGYYPRDLEWKQSSLHFKAELIYGGDFMDQQWGDKHVSYLAGQSQVSYRHDKIGDVQLDYIRYSNKSLTSETVTRRANDYWLLTASRSFLLNRIDLSVTYVLPVKWGVSSNSYSMTRTPYYTMHTSYDAYELIRNRLTASLSIHLANGHRVRKKSNAQTRESELYNEY